jgi:hypothetical protein
LVASKIKEVEVILLALQIKEELESMILTLAIKLEQVEKEEVV